MKKNIFLFIFSCFLWVMNTSLMAAEELYIITTRDGSAIVAREYTFTDQYVEFVTENGLPGYIKKEEFVSISNMVGVPPGETERVREQVSREERNKNLQLLAAGVLIVLFIALLLFLSGRKGKQGAGESDIHYGRIEKDPTTQGHLSFEYRGTLGGTSKWVVDVRCAYEVEGILFVEGLCTATDKRKTFRADRVVGPVTDLSSDHHAPMENFFKNARGEE